LSGRATRKRQLRFEALVREALADLPEQFRQRLQNVAVVIEDRPSPGLLRTLGMPPDSPLFGLYEGVPLTVRGDAGSVLPDRITIFREPIERTCRTRAEVKREVRDTVIHEVAHYFGLSDAEIPF